MTTLISNLAQSSLFPSLILLQGWQGCYEPFNKETVVNGCLAASLKRFLFKCKHQGLSSYSIRPFWELL